MPGPVQAFSPKSTNPRERNIGRERERERERERMINERKRMSET